MGAIQGSNTETRLFGSLADKYSGRILKEHFHSVECISVQTAVAFSLWKQEYELNCDCDA